MISRMFLLAVSLLLSSVVHSRATEINSSPSIKLEAGKAFVGSFPSIASLRVFVNNSNSSVHICSGHFIDKFWILTGAECLANEIVNSNPKAVQIFAGSNTLNPGRGYEYYAKNIFVHPDYHDSVFANLGLIELDRVISSEGKFEERNQENATASEDYNYKPIPVEIGWLEPRPEAQLVMAGWGYVSKNSSGDGLSKELHRAPMATISPKECAKEINETGVVTGVYFDLQCAKAAAEADKCLDEVGGAVIDLTSGRLVGIATTHEYQCRDTYTVFYTKVAKYLGWINKVTGISFLVEEGYISRFDPDSYFCKRYEMKKHRMMPVYVHPQDRRRFLVRNHH